MAHIVCVHVPGQSLADYRQVLTELGTDPPPGRLGIIAGESDGALHVVSVWADRAASDRFAGDHLFPAFVRTGLGPGTGATFVSFDTEELAVEGHWPTAATAAGPSTTADGARR